MNVTDTRKAILRNIQSVAGKRESITRQQYRDSRRARFASSTVEKYFSGSFTKAVRRALGR